MMPCKMKFTAGGQQPLPIAHWERQPAAQQRDQSPVKWVGIGIEIGLWLGFEHGIWIGDGDGGKGNGVPNVGTLYGRTRHMAYT